MQNMRQALIQMHLAVLLWGFTGILGRAISLDAPVLVWYRMLLTAVFMAAILTWRKQWVRIGRDDMRKLILIGGLMGAHWISFYASIKLANVSIALVCLSTASIFTPLSDPIINKGKLEVKEVLLGMLAIVGVYLIYQFQQFYAWGILAGIVAALLSSVFTIYNKQIADKYPPRTMVFYEMSAGWGVISIVLPILLYFRPDMSLLPQTAPLTADSWYKNDIIWLVVLSLCCTVWAQSLALSALRVLSSFTATLSVNLEPVYGILLAFFFYNENRELIFLDGGRTVNVGFLSGMSLILLSVVLQTFRLIRPRIAGMRPVRGS